MTSTLRVFLALQLSKTSDGQCPRDTATVQDALKPAQSAAQDAIQQLARLVSQQPDLEFPISRDRAQTWLINTYLDDVGSVKHSTQIAMTLLT